MEMILVDWTRMGRVYCLAGAVADKGGGWQFVRPLLVKTRESPVRNTGWSPYLMDGRSRWERFELVGVQSAPPEPPHLEDVWVRGMRPLNRLADSAVRRAILEAGLRQPGQPVFGVALTKTRASAFMEPGHGQRSLATLEVPQGHFSFTCAQRVGLAEVDYRAALDVPGLEGRTLPVKDHFLLQRAASAGKDPAKCQAELARLVSEMGDTIAVRLGLSRPYSGNEGQGQAGQCWLMADGFFSLADPQP